MSFFLLLFIFLSFTSNSSKNIVQTFSKSETNVIENEKKVKLPILMYHNITKKPSLLNKYCILESQFENDLKYIKEHGYVPVTIKELLDYVNNGGSFPEKPIMITFDDGYESFYVYAYPLLKKYNMKAVMSIVGSYTDLFTEEEDHNTDYSHLNWKQVSELNNSGYVEIGNHTYDMHKISAQRKGCGIGKGESTEKYQKNLKYDLEKLQKQILNYSGKKATAFAYPYGYMSEGSMEVIKDIGFKVVFTCTEVVNIIDNKDVLFNLGRFNRENGLSSSQFFKKMLK